MAARSLVKKFCEETVCSVCLDYFKDPVILDCGHNFCQACLVQCWEEADMGVSCPQCREVFQQKNFRPNRQLENFVELVRELQVEKGAEGKWGGCERHQEPLTLFCVTDQAPICVVCDRSVGHQNHTVLPMEEAFLEYKAQLQVEKKRTKLAFQQLHNYLEKEEHLRLSQLEEMEKEMANRDKENGARFSEAVSHLSRLITEMERKSQQSENDFLQDPKTTLSRYVQEPKRQLLGPPLELEEAVLTHAQKTPALEQALAKCQGSLKYAVDEALYKVNVTLAMKTAHPKLIVSPDMKSVRWGSSRGNLPDNPERFDTLSSVLGREKFTSGRHCWEVKGVSGKWAVGVARESVRRKGNTRCNPDEGFWVVQIKHSNYSFIKNSKWSASTSSQSVTLPANVPQKIWVSLDYEGGCVEFFYAETKEKLFAFPSASFSGEALRPCFILYSKASLKCCS